MDSSTEPRSISQKLAGFVKRIPGGSLIFAVFPLVLISYLAWFYYGAEHIDRTLYALRLENIHATEQPAWIDSNLNQEVFEGSALERISLLDPEACRLIAQAYEAHVWVKSTKRVSRSMGGQVTVDVVFRRPVAMVMFGVLNAPDDEPNKVFLPLDDDATVLPTDGFSGEALKHYFVIESPNPRQYLKEGVAGSAFGDPGVAAAVELCVILEPGREQLGLERVFIHQDSGSGSKSPFTLTLTAKGGSRIVWGHIPGGEVAGEPTVESKLARLTTWMSSNRGTSASLDLRTSAAVQPVTAQLQ